MFTTTYMYIWIFIVTRLFKIALMLLFFKKCVEHFVNIVNNSVLYNVVGTYVMLKSLK